MIRSGFSLLDVLVSLSVIAMLLAILLPSLSRIKETSNRIICGSNIRQVGLGIALYGNDWDDLLPPSSLAQNSDYLFRMDTLRLWPSYGRGGREVWDGLGRLYLDGQIRVPMVFYCPSYLGRHTFEQYAGTWMLPEGMLVGNYILRGVFPPDLVPPRAALRRHMIPFSDMALAADSMRSAADYSHVTGANVLRVDLSVDWFRDWTQSLSGLMPPDDGGNAASNNGSDAWDVLDGDRDGGDGSDS